MSATKKLMSPVTAISPQRDRSHPFDLDPHHADLRRSSAPYHGRLRRLAVRYSAAAGRRGRQGWCQEVGSNHRTPGFNRKLFQLSYPDELNGAPEPELEPCFVLLSVHCDAPKGRAPTGGSGPIQKSTALIASTASVPGINRACADRNYEDYGIAGLPVENRHRYRCGSHLLVDLDEVLDHRHERREQEPETG